MTHTISSIAFATMVTITVFNFSFTINPLSNHDKEEKPEVIGLFLKDLQPYGCIRLYEKARMIFNVHKYVLMNRRILSIFNSLITIWLYSYE
jgi:UV DNA damage repair endonuclease